MFVKSTSVWHLPAAILTLTLLLYLLTGAWFSTWISGGFQPRRTGGIYEILSPDTVDALYDDGRLHHAVVSLSEAMAQGTENLGERLNSDSLRNFARNLTEQLAKIKMVQPQRKKRGLLDDIGNALTGGLTGGGTAADGQPSGTDLLGQLGQALGLSGNGTGGLTGLLQQGLSGIGNELIGQLATPALFLGIGVGMGTETGLNLTDMEQSKAQATKVAASYNAQPTGVNIVAQNLGSGLSAQIAPSLGNQANGAQLGMGAFALAQGIGRGTASGLKLTDQQFQPSNDSGVEAVAGNFGLGVSQPIASSIDTQKLLSGANSGQLTQQLPQIAAAAGKGLGEGASAGLGLTKQNANPQRRQAPDLNQVDIPGTVGEFTRGLSQSFLETADLNKALNNVAPGAGEGLNNIDLMSMIMPVASGAGQGIGEGAAIGLGFKTDPGLPPMSGDANSTQKTELVTAEFSKGLVASFLANGTGQAALEKLMANGGGLTKDIQPAKVAEGLARGLVEGSVNAISRVGGIDKVIAGDFSLDTAMNLPAMQPSTFDDTANGSAIAFGRGISGEGTLLIAKVIINATKGGPIAKRDVGINEEDEFGVVPYEPAMKRQEASPGTTLAINGSMISSLVQVGTDAITCQGVGGISSLLSGLSKSGTLDIDIMNPPKLDEQTLAALPKEPIRILSEGNTFEINIQNSELTVNGRKLVPFIVITGIHITLVTIAFYLALPLYLALGALWRLSVLIGYPVNEAANKKWRLRILLGLFVPTSVVGLILGMVGMGNAAHFRSAHGIFGLITLLIIPPTVVASILRLRSKAPLPPPEAYNNVKQLPNLYKSPSKIYLISTIFHAILSQLSTLTWILGFTLLRSISLCIVDAALNAAVVAGLVSTVVFLQISSMSVVSVRFWVEGRVAKTMKVKEGIEGRVLEFGDEKGTTRSDSKKAYAFYKVPKGSPEPPPKGRPELTERNLLGRDDSRIGWPSNVRKFGEEDTFAAQAVTDDDPFGDSNALNVRRTPSGRVLMYNGKLGGYEPGAFRDLTSQAASYSHAPSVDSRSSWEEPRAPVPALQTLPQVDPVGRLMSPSTQQSRPRSERSSGEEIRMGYAGMAPVISQPGVAKAGEP